MSTNVPAAKADLRRHILSQRQQLSTEDVRQASTEIVRAVAALPMYANAGTICSYLAIGNEVQTAALIISALYAGKIVALPRTIPASRALALHAISSLDGLAPGPYGILEPPADAPRIDPAEVDLFLVPGAVFDAAGHRIGYGAGYYDTMLAGSDGWRVALAYALQLAPVVPSDAHDVPMDLIVTEAGVIDCVQARVTTDHLRLRKMAFIGHHGAYAHEREHGIRLEVDLDLRLDLQLPGLTDMLETAVDYPRVYRLIQRIQSERECTLLESLAARIAQAILQEFPVVCAVTVAVRKFNPPVGGLLDAFEVEITRERLASRRRRG